MIYLNKILLELKSAHSHLLGITKLTEKRINSKQPLKVEGFFKHLKQAEENINGIECYFSKVDKEITRLKSNESKLISLCAEYKQELIEKSKKIEELKQNIEL